MAYAYQNRATYLEEKQAEEHQPARARIRRAAADDLHRPALPARRKSRRPSSGDVRRDLAVRPAWCSRSCKRSWRPAGDGSRGRRTGLPAPARPLETITCHDILLALRASQGQELATRDEPTRAEVYGEFHRIEEAERQAASSVTMLALVNRAQARLQLAPPPATEDLKPVAAPPTPTAGAPATPPPKPERPPAPQRADEEPTPFPD